MQRDRRSEFDFGVVESAEAGGKHRQLMVDRTGRGACARGHLAPEGTQEAVQGRGVSPVTDGRAELGPNGQGEHVIVVARNPAEIVDPQRFEDSAGVVRPVEFAVDQSEEGRLGIGT